MSAVLSGHQHGIEIGFQNGGMSGPGTAPASRDDRTPPSGRRYDSHRGARRGSGGHPSTPAPVSAEEGHRRGESPMGGWRNRGGRRRHASGNSRGLNRRSALMFGAVLAYLILLILLTVASVQFWT